MQRRKNCGSGRQPARERGAVLILFVIALVAIIAIAALALDSGHAALNKTRLQNTVDAAALGAAKVLDDTGSVAQAEAEALAMFAGNASGQGHEEMNAAYASGDLTVTVEFSSTLLPFVPGSSPEAYVRVRAQNFTMPAWFAAVVGIDEKTVGASAVAGPSPTIDEACNLMPMMVCGDPAAGPPFFGYTLHQPDVLKTSSTQGDFEVGPGNFQLIRLGDEQGGAVIREGMAGSYDACMATGDMIETEPGNTIGPVAQGFNTRFGDYQGPMGGMQSTYPPDVVTTQPVPPLTYDVETDTISQSGNVITDSQDIDFAHTDYRSRVESSTYDNAPAPAGIGAFQRREVAVAIGDCSTATTGHGFLPLLGFGCFFLLQEVEHKGNDAFIYGEFIEDCRTGGMPGPAPTNIPGPYIIQLYRDYGSDDA